MRRLTLAVVATLGMQLISGSPTALGACSTRWTEIASPGGIFAADVAAVDVDSAWFVATANNAGGTDKGWVSSYDGVTWTPRSFPQPGTQERIRGVTATSDSDVWLVGDYSTLIDEVTTAYVAHWDGASFTQMPVDLGQFPTLTSADALAPDDAWAAGWHYVDGKYRSLVIRWNGTVWSEVATPMPPAAERMLFDVDAISSRDVWAVGTTYRHGLSRPLALHWNGFRWRTVPLPDVGTSYPGLFGVSGQRHRRVWAVGQVENGARSLIMRWDGAAWTVVPSPNPSPNGNSLYDVLDAGATQAWAVGSKDGGRPLLVRWNGTEWRAVRTPGDVGRRGIVAIDGGADGSMFIVGNYPPDGGGLALERCPAP